MTFRPTRSTRSHHMVEDDWGRVVYNRQQPAARQGTGGYIVAFLLLLAILVLCVTAFLVIRVLLPDRTPALPSSFVTWTPSPVPASPEAQPTASPTIDSATGETLVFASPQQGYINTLVTVTGQGWWPGEPVFVFLRSPEEGDGRGYSYAAAVADEWGNFRTALTFPNEMRWIGQQWADVIARGTRSGKEASTRFTLLVPTPTHTPPPPTPRPTLVPTTPAPTPTPSPTNTPEPTPMPEVSITDWRGEYFVGMTPSGDPVLARNDVAVNFNWGSGSPGEGIPADHFSARWTRRPYFHEGIYRFTTTADDGMRLWIDGQLVLDEWHDSTQETYIFDIHIPEGQHALHVEFYENLGGAGIYLSWAQLVAPPEPQPSTPEPVIPPPSNDWWGEYYDNPNLEGQPVLSRTDPALSFDWGTGSPGEGIPRNHFSVRWRRDIWGTAGTYRFSLEVDDGARLWVDGQLLIDAWPATIGEIYTAEVYLSDGVHTLEVEYFEATVDARIQFWIEAVR